MKIHEHVRVESASSEKNSFYFTPLLYIHCEICFASVSRFSLPFSLLLLSSFMSRQVQYAATPSSPDVDVESRDLIGEHEVDKYLEDQHSGAGSSSGSRTWRIVFFLQLTVLLGLVGYVVYLTQFIQQQQQRQLALMGDQQLQAQTFQELQREEAREAAKKR